MDLQEVLPSGWAWTIIALLITLTIGPYAIFSRESSEKFWVIGRLARWVRRRKLREIEDTATLADMTLKAHSDDRARWALQMQEMRKEMDEDRARFRLEIEELDARSREYWAYIVYATDHSRQVDFLAAKYGWEPAPPRLLSFREWSADRGDG